MSVGVQIIAKPTNLAIYTCCIGSSSLSQINDLGDGEQELNTRE
jgi:hypothetical protein